MLHFQRIDPVRSLLPLKYIAFVGAGGKTSLCEYLASRLIDMGKTVAITTTTKIYAREPYCISADSDFQTKLTMPLVRVGKTIEAGKLTAVDTEDIIRLGEAYDTVLIEADGAKGKPLKVPAPYEPVIPALAEKIFVVSGLDALYGKIHEVVFRWELLHDSTKNGGNSIITPDIFKSFFSERILLKGDDLRKCSVVLNKYEMLGQRRRALDVARGLCQDQERIDVIVSSVRLRTFYKISH